MSSILFSFPLCRFLYLFRCRDSRSRRSWTVLIFQLHPHPLQHLRLGHLHHFPLVSLLHRLFDLLRLLVQLLVPQALPEVFVLLLRHRCQLLEQRLALQCSRSLLLDGNFLGPLLLSLLLGELFGAELCFPRIEAQDVVVAPPGQVVDGVGGRVLLQAVVVQLRQLLMGGLGVLAHPPVLAIQGPFLVHQPQQIRQMPHCQLPRLLRRVVSC
mmetsp:Transcript_680/g.1790  ORF Transcript_680/g.1790 Transcript_680/m.1790 type:complete len:212 (-) Transcript_680:441-1076(-)